MNCTIQTQGSRNMYFNVQLEDTAVMADITKAMRMIRGIVSVHPVRKTELISPSLKRRIARAEKNFSEGKTIKFNTVADMDAYLDTL